MKSASIREFRQSVKRTVDISQSEQVVITRRGMPAAILIGVEGKDWEHVRLETSPRFWRLINQRRKQETIPMAETRRRLKTT